MSLDKHSKLPFEGLIVLELGERIGAAACGSLLAMAGATVIVAEPSISTERGKYRDRALSCSGKRSIVVRPGDEKALQHAVDAADIVVTSSDMPDDLAQRVTFRPHTIVCDITALPEPAPTSALLSDKLLQALSGIASTTGTMSGPPTLSDAAILELGAGMYAASAAIAALRVRRTCGGGQRIRTSIYGSAISTLTTFLPFHFSGHVPPRAGNGHPMAAPWNAYQASDGWLLLCSANDDQWRRLCGVMNRPDIAESGPLAKLADRVKNRDEVDAIVQAWIGGHTVDQAVEMLGKFDIAAGPIITVDDLHLNPNVRHRKMVRYLRDPESGDTVAVPGTPLAIGRAAAHIPARDEDREFVLALPRKESVEGSGASNVRPLEGIRVLEIGQYTTAPLAAKQLAAFGADVIKIEPLQGEASRAWLPHLEGESYFFTLNNTSKRSLAMDLRIPEHREVFANLIRTSDVLVENLKPGSLNRLGFSYPELQALNPRLVYCAISGYGADSAYPGRPAFDTVIQAMSGLMDVTRADGTPTKLGISIADTAGGMMGLFCIMAMLEARDRSGLGAFIDLAMQDVGVWLTQNTWRAHARTAHCVIAGADGEVAALAESSRADGILAAQRIAPRKSDRAALVAALIKAGIPAAPVRTIDEVGLSEKKPGGFIRLVQSGTRTWPLLELPFKLSRMSAPELKAIGELGTANDEFGVKID